MTHSESLNELAPALSAAQGEMEHAHKNAENPYFRSSYANLAELIDTVGPVLAKHGLSVVQLPGYEAGTVTLETMLLHQSGQWIRGLAGAPIAIQYAKDGRELPPSPQGVGSAITYLRRYSLAALCNITQDDDDGEAASDRSESGGSQQKQPASTEPQPECPNCKGPMWDNRAKKKSGEIKSNAPDYSCKDKKTCKGAFWPGQWPPKDLSTDLQHEQMETLLSFFADGRKELAAADSKVIAKLSKWVGDRAVSHERMAEAIIHMRDLVNKYFTPVEQEEMEQDRAFAGTGV